MQVRLTYREPRITEREPDAPDSLTEREPKFAMIASPAADKCKPLQLGPPPPVFECYPGRLAEAPDCAVYISDPLVG